MKILFICGSLEPGRDGVGDYTRRLAGELIRQGNEVKIIAYNDKYSTQAEDIEQMADGTGMRVLRIPSLYHSKQKVASAKQFIDIFNPEWLSLQYVPFAFQDKGLPIGLAAQLKELGKGRKWHIMFHELWVGMDNEATLKHKLWGKVQRGILLNMVKLLKPIVSHTQTQIYQLQLKRAGIHAEILPLFGNIPVVKCEVLPKDKNKLLLVVFGSIHSGAPIQQFAKELSLYQKKHHQKMLIQFIGRCSMELQTWLDELHNAELETKVWGEQSSKTISEVLQNADWGISTTPYLLCKKSGTVAAMLEHKLPILNVSGLWQVEGYQMIDFAKFIYIYEADLLENLIMSKTTINQTNTLKELTHRFSNTLKATN